MWQVWTLLWYDKILPLINEPAWWDLKTKVPCQSLINLWLYTPNRIESVTQRQGQKPKGRWFKPCPDHLMLCIVSLNEALYPHYLNSPSCNWVPAYAGVNMGWTSVLSRGSQWLSSVKHHGNPLHLIGGGFNFNWTEFLSWSHTPYIGHQIGLGWFFQCIDWCTDFNFQDFKIYIVYYAAATLS